MSRRGAASEVAPTIEFVAPNDAAFGASDVADFVGFEGRQAVAFDDDLPPRSRWLMAFAVVAVTGLIGGGVIAAAPWDSSTTASPATTAPTTPTTDPPAPTTTRERTLRERLGGALVEPTGWVIDEGAFGLAAAGAFSNGPELATSYLDEDWLDLWVSPGFAHNAGRWLAIVSRTGQGGADTLIEGAVRVDLGGRPGLLTTSDDGVFRLLFTGPDGTPFDVAGFGFSLAELIGITASTTMVDGRVSYGDARAAGEPLSGLAPAISKAIPWGNLAQETFGWSTASTNYLVPESLQWITLQRGPTDAEADVLASLLIAPEPESPMTLTIEGAPRSVTLGTLAGHGSIARWSDGGETTIITSSGLHPRYLAAIAAGTREATSAEWIDLVVQSQEGFQFANMPEVVPVNLGSGNLGDGSFWTADVYGASFVLSDNNTFGASFPVPAGDLPDLRTYSTESATFVVATSAWPATARTLRVTVGDGPPQDSTLVELGDTPTYMGIIGFADNGAFTAELLDVAGVVVARL